MRQDLVNGDTGLSIRSKINDNFEELYALSSSGLNYLGVLSVPGDGIPTSRPDGTDYVAGDYYLIEVAGDYSFVVCNQWDALILNQDGTTWEAFSGNVKGPREEIQYSTDLGKTISPVGQNDPLEITTITHSFTKTYSVIPKCDLSCTGAFWGIYISSITITQVVIGCSGIGDATAATFDYKILVF